MAGKYDPYDEQTIFQKCTCALAGKRDFCFLVVSRQKLWESKSQVPKIPYSHFWSCTGKNSQKTGRNEKTWVANDGKRRYEMAKNLQQISDQIQGRSKNGDGFLSWLMGFSVPRRDGIPAIWKTTERSMKRMKPHRKRRKNMILVEIF